MKKDSVYKYKGKLLRIERAPEPSDVYWENAGITTSDKYTRRVITNFLLIFVMLGIFGIIFGINYAKVSGSKGWGYGYYRVLITGREFIDSNLVMRESIIFISSFSMAD